MHRVEPRPAPSLADIIDRLTVPGELYRPLRDGKLQCYACGHRCVIFPGKRGICKVRVNERGALRVPWGYVAGLQCDPTEKKPFNHVLPGSHTLTFGMLGCAYACASCHNWLTSQALRDPAAGVQPTEVTPRTLIDLARRHGAALVGSSYNEPLITSEWAVAVFQEAKAAGLRTCYVSNGTATPEVLDFLRPWTDCYKVDLKAKTQRNYRALGGGPAACARDDPHGVQPRLLAGGGHPRYPRLERFRRRTAGRGGVDRLGLTLHPLARVRVPQGLPHDRSGRHGAGDIAARGPHRRGRGAQVRLRGEPARTRGAVRAHLVPPLRGPAGRTVRLLHPAEPPRAGRPLPRVRHGDPGYLAVS